MQEHWKNYIPKALVVVLTLLLAIGGESSRIASAQSAESEKAHVAETVQLSEEEQKILQSASEAVRFREMEAREAVARFEAARNAYFAVIYKFLSDNGLKSSEYDLGEDRKSFVRKSKKSEVPLPSQGKKE